MEILAKRLHGWTLAEIAREMGVSAERVRQLEARALKKWRVSLPVLQSPKGRRGGERMPIRLTGMSEVTRNMEALKRALDGAVEKASFDPANPKDMERAIREIEMKVDLKMAPYMTSPGVREIASGLKSEYRKAILQRAEAARKPSPS